MTILLLMGVPIEFLANLAVALVTGVQDQLTQSVKNVYAVALESQKANSAQRAVRRHYVAHIRTGELT